MILLPALLAGLMAIGATLAVERWGGVVGGVLGALPTTIVPASLGLAAASGAVGFQDAMQVIPVGMLLNVGFLWLWRVGPKRLPHAPLRTRLVLMVCLSLGTWGLTATATVLTMGALRDAGVDTLLLGVGAALLTLGVGLAATRARSPAPRGSRSVPLAVIMARGVLAAVAIGCSVLLAQNGGALVAALAAVFPAIFLTTMAGLWLSQGAAVPAGAVGPMMLGSLAVSVYALLSAQLMVRLGPEVGAALSWVLAVGGVSLPAALWLRRGGCGPVSG